MRHLTDYITMFYQVHKMKYCKEKNDKDGGIWSNKKKMKVEFNSATWL